MTQSLLLVAAFLLVLVCLPSLARWARLRFASHNGSAEGQCKFVSALAVGPHQRVVTVEVGPESARVWLTLGVTAQNIQCLHSAPLSALSADGVAHSGTSLQVHDAQN